VAVLKGWLATESLRLRIRALKARFRDQKVEFNIIRRHLSPGDIACDIGAYKGSFTYWLSRWCRSGRVVAFEPQPDFAHRLVCTCRVLGLGNVAVEAKAVWSHSGQKDFFVPRLHRPGASLNRQPLETTDIETLSVPVVSLDEYFDERVKIDFIKIDAEGAELEILKGAEQILRRHAPLLLFECENRHLAQGSVQDVFSYLESLGYDGSFVCRNRLLPISRFDAAIHQRQDGERFWKSKGYCNNFVFQKPRRDIGTGVAAVHPHQQI
jgi:FkbM family methyltransferase